MLLPVLLCLPFLAALLMPFVGSRRQAAWLAASAPLLGLLLLARFAPRVMSEAVPYFHQPWLPSLGLDLSLRMDGLAWMFALLVLAIGALIVLYAAYYLSPKDSARRFFGYLLLFMGAMLGLVIAGNLLLMVVFWELTSISSFLLIGFWSQQRDARRGARMALSITAMGGLALLGGAVLIGQVVGSYELDAVLAAGDQIRADARYPAIVLLVLAGVFTKSAQFPFQFWLPQAMAAPTPVSAYLHSATMVKAGVFLLARLYPILSGSDLFFWLVSGVGAATLLIGAWAAIFQHDLKGLLAYSTISHLGLITLLFGLSRPLAVVAALFHILNHATFKAGLFMAAGIIDHETGTRDMRRLGNLRHYLPYTSVLAIIASLAMAGIPLLNGFLSKEMFFAQALELPGDGARLAFALVAFAAGALGVAYSLRFVHDTFFGTGPRRVNREIHEPPRFMRVPVAILVVLCLAVGVAPGLTVAPVLAAAVHGVLGSKAPEYSLALWHGINPPLLMSAGGLVVGIGLYFALRRWWDLHARENIARGRRLFEWNVDTLFNLAQRFTSHVADGGLRRSLAWLLMVALVVGVAPYLAGEALPTGRVVQGQPMPILGWMLWAVLLLAVFGTLAVHRRRMTALIVIGAVGLMVSLTFAFLSAPDLALTQLLVEMVTIALMMMALNYLPKESGPTLSRPRKWRDIGLATLAGGGVGALAWAMMTRPSQTIAGELLARSLPEAHGRNVVNVILVDFRGLDTLGEIAVFGIAALVVHALLKWARLPPDEVVPGPPVSLPIPADLTQLLFPLTLTVSFFLFLRGHNAPGGGFIAGLAIAVPVLVKYVLQGARSVEATFGFDYLRGIGLGLIVAVLGGLGSLLFQLPFLTSGYIAPSLPLIGELPLASALVFDTGVYLVVFCGALLMLSTLGTVRHRYRAAGDAP
ncbi:monovalent cation/H+ antiporter subunit A [Luteimonas sp. e5]